MKAMGENAQHVVSLPGQAAAPAVRTGRRRPSLGIRARADAEEYGRLRFVEYAASLVKPLDRVLDAGAGERPHRRYFDHAEYESCDHADNSTHSHAFLCDIRNIPKEDATYDAVLCVQVLSYIPTPQRAIDEFYRVLRPGGSLFLTAPQGWGHHGPPQHYFGFTCHGLEWLFRNAGFEVVSVESRGGIFWYLGRRIRKLPTYIFEQHRPTRGVLKRIAWAAALPVYALSLPLCRYVIPLVCFYLDRLDGAKEYTLGYACHCRKPVASAE
jgi:SAM-dependent methyltransferase